MQARGQRTRERRHDARAFVAVSRPDRRMMDARQARDAAHSAVVRAPFGALGVATDGGAVVRLAYLPAGAHLVAPSDRVAARAAREIERYLDDPAFRFTVPIAPKGTPFQRRVWDAILDIPAGESRTYGELARKMVTAARAIGQACGANPIALIIPCHRVVGSLGSLGGFMGTAGVRSGSDPHSAGSLLIASDDRRAKREPDRDLADLAPHSPAAIKRWLLNHEGYRFGR
jgi:methylated-DNA-[protein]-cysteine S-methyltransferase